VAGNSFPKLHNAMWPGLVGKGGDSEPPIDLDTMIALTVGAEVDGVRFDGIDIFHAGPHTNIDFTDDEVKRLADKVAAHGLAIGSIVAPVWEPVGGGSAMGSAEDRARFVANVRKSCDPRRFGGGSGRLGRRSGWEHQAYRPDLARGL
jgi:adenosylmethionine-8-amino-7-oxononanoate aminotransferase